jgi:hypothetical protein
MICNGFDSAKKIQKANCKPNGNVRPCSVGLTSSLKIFYLKEVTNDIPSKVMDEVSHVHSSKIGFL